MDIKILKPMIAKITWLYYINDYTQQQIADSMHISRTKVTRYLQKAKEMGLVKITVDTEYHSFFDKEQQLMKLLSLDDILIVPTVHTPDETMRNVGLAGAALLSNLIKGGDILGLAWGRSIYHLAMNLEPVKQASDEHLEVIQLMGGLSTSGRMNPEEIVKEIANKLNAKGTWLNTPAVVSSRQTRDMLMSDAAVASVFEKAKTCTKCLLGLGDVDDDASLRETGSLSSGALRELREKGAVGDILARFFDVNGKEVPSSVSERIMSVPLDVIRRVPDRIAFTTGLQKVGAIIGAARGGYINMLVTDEKTADGVISKLQDFSA